MNRLRGSGAADGNIWFCGDVHGDIRHLKRALAAATSKPRALILLGDLDPPEPVGAWLAPLEKYGSEVWFIHGNHETDSEELYRNMFLSPGSERNLDGRVVEIGGLRVAGLGGVFREQAWYPPAPPRSDCYEAMVEHMLRAVSRNQRRQWDGQAADRQLAIRLGQVRKHRSSIFPATHRELARMRADVLVVHEAPRSHPHGFGAIDQIAQNLGVKWAVHGHHHQDYRQPSYRGGLHVIGVGFRGVATLANRSHNSAL